MKRPRPHIPLSVRVAVAERQVQCRPDLRLYWDLYRSRLTVPLPWPLKDRLHSLLYQLSQGETIKLHLDHRPPLILRMFDLSTGKYHPDANDPRHLEYITIDEHQQRTTGRKIGAEKTVTTKGSDIHLKAKFARLESSPKPKQKIPSRPFPQRKSPWPTRSKT